MKSKSRSPHQSLGEAVNTAYVWLAGHWSGCHPAFPPHPSLSLAAGLGIPLAGGCATSHHCQQQELPGIQIHPLQWIPRSLLLPRLLAPDPGDGLAFLPPLKQSSEKPKGRGRTVLLPAGPGSPLSSFLVPGQPSEEVVPLAFFPGFCKNWQAQMKHLLSDLITVLPGLPPPGQLLSPQRPQLLQSPSCKGHGAFPPDACHSSPGFVSGIYTYL